MGKVIVSVPSLLHYWTSYGFCCVAAVVLQMKMPDVQLQIAVLGSLILQMPAYMNYMK